MRDLRPVGSSRPGGPVGIRVRAAITDLGRQPAKPACLGDGIGIDAVEGGIQRRDRLAGRVPGRLADLSAHDPPAQLATGHLTDAIRIEVQRPVSTLDVGQEAVVAAACPAEPRGGARQPERGAERLEPPDTRLLMIHQDEQRNEASRLPAVIGLPRA